MEINEKSPDADIYEYLMEWTEHEEAIADVFFEAFTSGTDFIRDFDPTLPDAKLTSLLQIEAIVTKGQNIFKSMNDCRAKVDRPLNSLLIDCVNLIEEFVYRWIEIRDKRLLTPRVS